jgi:uncharacterized DUF497 family protein
LLRFDWSDRKAATNLEKHGVSFEEAVTVFGDPLALDIDDPDHSDEECRFLIIGNSENRQLLVVSYTHAGADPNVDVIRIITARRVEPRERRRYVERG